MGKIALSTKKIIAIAVIAVVVIVGAVAGVLLLKDNGYRLIKIYQIIGQALLERENVGEMDAYENLIMKEHDTLKVNTKSNVRLQMDEDKYALVEELSELNIVTKGNAQDSKTYIDLKKGAVTIEIQNKLSEESVYQITTPNSVMAVRGTVFRVAVSADIQGRPITKLNVFEGAVTVRKEVKDETGNIVEVSEEVTSQKGGQVIIRHIDNAVSVDGQTGSSSENNQFELIVSEESDYSDIHGDSLRFLEDVIENTGRELSVDKEAISKLREELPEELKENVKPEEPATGDEIATTAAEATSEAVTEAATEAATEAVDITEATTEAVTEAVTNAAQVPTEAITEAPTEVVTEVVTETPTEAATEAPTEAPTEEPTEEESAEESDDSSDSEGGGAVVEETTAGSYIVTFMYDNKVFATQVVEAGGYITKPLFQPAPYGTWDTAVLNAPVTADIAINFYTGPMTSGE